ncbi:hypothetical protein R1sor_011162 [Riccia sorocarpa]|uniref:Protein kinase domain-containing protein n=1 Tax=Riccia sorocarpa TaxID=122646 RepID=A0ABD3I1B5_9MARC
MQGDVVLDKENVLPRGSAGWGHRGALLKSKGPVTGHDAVRKERPGILAPNSTTNNGGGAVPADGTLESIRERVKLLKLSSVNGALGESGFRLGKQRTPLADIRPSEVLGSSTARNAQLKDGTGHGTLQERTTPQSVDMSSLSSKISHSRTNIVDHSDRNTRNLHSSGGHAGSKSSWTGSFKGLELYHDPTTSRDQGEAKRSPVEAWFNSAREMQDLLGSNSVAGERQLGVIGSMGRTASEPENDHSISPSRYGSVWSRAKKPATPYKRCLHRLPIPEKDGAAEDGVEHEVDQKRSYLHSRVYKSSFSAAFQGTEKVGDSGRRGSEEKAEVRTLFDGMSRSHITHSVGSITEGRSSEDLGSIRLTSDSLADVRGGGSAEKKICFYGSSGILASSEPAIASEENDQEKEASKSASLLLAKMSGVSSSGSSSTPSSGGSCNDEDTVGYPGKRKPTTPVSGEYDGRSLRKRLNSRSRIKCFSGPPIRVLITGTAARVPIDDGSSAFHVDQTPNIGIRNSGLRSSPSENGLGSSLETGSPVTPEADQKVPDDESMKTKAEDDPSVRDVPQAVSVCRGERKSPTTESIQSSVASVHRFLRATLRGDTNESLHSLEKVEEFRPLPQTTDQRGAEASSAVGSQPAQGVTPPEESSRKLYGGLVPSPPLEMSDVRHPMLLSREKVTVTPKERFDRGGRSLSSVFTSLLTGQHNNNSVSSDARRKSPEQPNGSGTLLGRDLAAEVKEVILLSRNLAAEVKEVREAVSMSQDGFPHKEKSETRAGHFQELSNSLGSLSLVDRDVQTKTQSRPSSLQPLQPLVNHYHNKSLENVAGVLTSSHSTGKSALTTENVPHQQQPGSLVPEMQMEEPPAASQEKLFKEPKVEANMKPRPPAGGYEAAASNGTSQDEGPEDVKATITREQRKVFEDKKFFWVSERRYQKLGMIGKGGSSEVYKVIDSEFSIYALKKIILGGRDYSTARGYYQEIEYLERLRGKRHIVQLIDYEVTNRSVVDESYGEEKIQGDACMYVVLEYGEIDLAGILSKKRKEMLESSEPLDDNWIRFYWKHMLVAVKTIHDERIVHADLKPANFLLVKGELKLIDFGIAKAIQSDTTNVARDAQVGTLNYMSPEALMNSSTDEDDRVFKCGRSSDIWSLGCILYQMVYGHTPFSDIKNMYRKIQAITSKEFKIPYPPVRDPWLLDAMQRCLTWNRFSRPNIQELLVHPFLRPDLAPPR